MESLISAIKLVFVITMSGIILFSCTLAIIYVIELIWPYTKGAILEKETYNQMYVGIGVVLSCVPVYMFIDLSVKKGLLD